MRITALDLALTRTGWAWAELDPETQGSGCFNGPGKGVDRLDAIERGLRPLWRGAGLVVVEGYAFGTQGRAHAIGELGGIMRLAWRRSGVPFAEVPPNALKKYATGKGNAAKEAVLAAAIRRLEYEGDDHNEADALWLLAMATDFYGWWPSEKPVPESHRAALKAVTWPEMRRAA